MRNKNVYLVLPNELFLIHKLYTYTFILLTTLCINYFTPWEKYVTLVIILVHTYTLKTVVCLALLAAENLHLYEQQQHQQSNLRHYMQISCSQLCLLFVVAVVAVALLLSAFISSRTQVCVIIAFALSSLPW